MSDINRYQILAEQTKKEFPRFNVKERDKSWLRPIFWVLGKITRRNYDTFTTTIASTMYVGPTWKKKSNDDKYCLLRHEKKHIKQAHCFPLGRKLWPVNHLIMGLLYVLVLPIIFTFRSKFEREGYEQTLLVQYELRGQIGVADMQRNSKWLSETFGTSTYFWMWRKKQAYAWAVETQRKINAGQITNEEDRVDGLKAT